MAIGMVAISASVQFVFFEVFDGFEKGGGLDFEIEFFLVGLDDHVGVAAIM